MCRTLYIDTFKKKVGYYLSVGYYCKLKVEVEKVEYRVKFIYYSFS